jgi:ribosome-associated translation inhibitor RaiA
MNPRIIVKNREKSPLLEQQVSKELTKLEKFIDIQDPLVGIDFIITAEGPTHKLYTVELRVKSPDYGESVARIEGYDLDLLIPEVTRKVVHELERAKRRAVDKRDRPDQNDNSLRKDKEDFNR